LQSNLKLSKLEKSRIAVGGSIDAGWIHGGPVAHRPKEDQHELIEVVGKIEARRTGVYVL